MTAPLFFQSLEIEACGSSNDWKEPAAQAER